MDHPNPDYAGHGTFKTKEDRDLRIVILPGNKAVHFVLRSSTGDEAHVQLSADQILPIVQLLLDGHTEIFDVFDS